MSDVDMADYLNAEAERDAVIAKQARRIKRLKDALTVCIDGGQLYDGDEPIDPLDVLYEADDE